MYCMFDVDFYFRFLNRALLSLSGIVHIIHYFLINDELHATPLICGRICNFLILMVEEIKCTDLKHFILKI